MTKDTYHIVAFYKVTPFADCAAFQQPLKTFMIDHDVKGTVLVTPEGINGTISGLPKNVTRVIEYLRERPEFFDLTTKTSEASSHVFERTKVKHKKEVISIGCPVDAINMPGTYVPAEEWNDLIQDPEVFLLDTRNDYETHLGMFKGAVDPKIKNFKEFPDFIEKNLNPQKHKKVAMFCTGGIRCEKSTAYLRQLGYENVYHLEGGILQYFEDIPTEESLWEGECYVFDERIAVDQDLKASADSQSCPACGHALTTKDRQKPEHIPGVCCRFCSPAQPAETVETTQAPTL